MVTWVLYTDLSLSVINPLKSVTSWDTYLLCRRVCPLVLRGGSSTEYTFCFSFLGNQCLCKSKAWSNRQSPHSHLWIPHFSWMPLITWYYYYCNLKTIRWRWYHLNVLAHNYLQLTSWSVALALCVCVCTCVCCRVSAFIFLWFNNFKIY